MSVSATSNLSFLGFGFLGNRTTTHLVEKGCFFFVCISWELSVHAAVGEVTADAMVGAVYYGLSILIITLSATVLIGGSFGFRRSGIFNLFLMLNFCAVGFSMSLSTLDLIYLYYDALFTGCSCTARMLAIYCCCDVNASISCRIALEASSLSPTETMV